MVVPSTVAKRRPVHLSPLGLMGAIALVAFSAEALIMALFVYVIPGVPAGAEIWLDAGFLTAITFVSLYVFLFRPMVSEIEERKHTESLLRQTATASREAAEETRKLASVVEQTADSVVITGLDGSILYVNPAFEQITGYSHDEVLGKTPRLLKSGQHDEKTYQDMWSTILAGRVYRGEFTNRRKDGVLFCQEATITPVRDEAGGLRYFVNTSKDVTERKQAEAELRVQELRARELQAHRDVMAGFVSIAAHDLKNPLTAIYAAAHILRRDKLSATGLEALSTMEQSTQQAIRLVQTYLDAMCLDEGHRLEVRTAPVEVRPVVERELELARSRIDERRLSTFTFLDEVPEGLLVLADESRLEQILGNLLENAVKYSPSGGKVTVAASCVEGEVSVEVRDSGVGLTAEDRGRLFQRFSRVGDRQTAKGSGLGLWITRQLVESQGGRLEAEGDLGRGSLFRFTLPRAPGPTAAS